MAAVLIVGLAVSLRASVPLVQECPVQGEPASVSVRNWSVAEVAEWARRENLQGIDAAVVTHAIDGPTLLLLNRRDLEELDLTREERKSLSDQLDLLRRGCSCSPEDFWSELEKSPYRYAVFGSFVEFSPESIILWAGLWDSEMLSWLWGCTCQATCPGWLNWTVLRVPVAIVCLPVSHALVALFAIRLVGAQPFVASSLVLEHTVQFITDFRLYWRLYHGEPLELLRMQLWRRLSAVVFSIAIPLVLLVLPAKIVLFAYFAWSWIVYLTWFISEILQTVFGSQEGDPAQNEGRAADSPGESADQRRGASAGR